MRFDFETTARLMKQEQEAAAAAQSETLGRAIELEADFMRWAERYGGKAGVDRQKLTLHFIASNNQTMSVHCESDDQYSVEYSGEAEHVFKPEGERVTKGLSERDMLRAVVAWYQKLP